MGFVTKVVKSKKHSKRYNNSIIIVESESEYDTCLLIFGSDRKTIHRYRTETNTSSYECLCTSSA